MRKRVVQKHGVTTLLLLLLLIQNISAFLGEVNLLADSS